MMGEKRVFQVPITLPQLGIWTCNLQQQNKSRYYTLSIQKWGPYLFELEEMITTKSLSLLSGLYHCSSYYCHNGLQLDAENSHLLQFYYISDSSNFISASVHLSYECMCVCCTGWQITLLSLSFIFDCHKFIIGLSLSFSLTIPNFCPL